MYTVMEYDHYLIVEFHTQPNLLEMETAIAEEFSRSRYAHTNDIWVFNENLPHIAFADYQCMESLILSIFPKKAEHCKTAIVVSSGLGQALANLWESSVDLPYEIETFTSLDEAKRWVSPENSCACMG